MAFLKYANAAVVKPITSLPAWDEVRHRAVTMGTAFDQRIAAHVVLKDYDPSKFLLSHATIIASVDTENGPGQLGRHFEDGFTVNRQYSNYYITPNTSHLVNSNGDAWERKLLLSTFRTFVGAENYCFVPGTMVVMADGTQKPIENVEVGDQVLTHEGRPRRVVRTFEHQVDEEICVLYFDRYKTPIKCTGEHPFRKLSVRAPTTRRNRNGKKSSQERYRRDALRKALRDGSGPFGHKVLAGSIWAEARTLERFDLVCGPKQGAQEGGTVEEGLLLGYYLAEGCLSRKYGKIGGIVLSFGAHEAELAHHSIELARKLGYETLGPRPTQSSTLRVDILGPGVGERFLRLGSEYSESKKIHPEVMSWSREALTAVLAGWLSGDAQRHKKTERIVGSTVSFDLACQMARIAEIVGVKASLWREKAESFCKRQQAKSAVTLTVGGEPRVFEVQAKHPAYNLIVSRGSIEKLRDLTPRWRDLDVKRSRKRDDFTWFDSARVHHISWVGREQYSGSVFNFEVEEDNSYVLGQAQIAVHNCEHLQIPELSKGKIIDAAARDIGESIYVDILVATDRKHKPLIAAIESGQLSTMSMGCSVAFTQCSKCGNVAEDETQLCACIRYSKLNKFFGGTGKPHIIAELCGHYTQPKSVKFIEASWVASPAFRGAVVRSFLTPQEQALLEKRFAPKIQVAFSHPTRVADPNMLQKAARRVIGQEFGDEQLEGAPQAAPTEDVDPLDAVVKELADTLRERAIKKVREEINKEDAPGPVGDENLNDTLIKSAALKAAADQIYRGITDPVIARRIVSGLVHYHQSGWGPLRGKYSGREILAISRFVDLLNKNPLMAGETRIYRTVLAVGGAAPYGDVESYLAACRMVIGRNLTQAEKEALVVKGRLFDLGS